MEEWWLGIMTGKCCGCLDLFFLSKGDFLGVEGGWL